MTIGDFLRDLECSMDFGEHDNSLDKKLRGFWCDNITSPYHGEHFTQIIKDNGFIELSMYFGKDVQERYKLILHFGDESRLYSTQKEYLYLKNCIPDFSKEPDSILINEKNNIVDVYLK
jgi:hypothetical protein